MKIRTVFLLLTFLLCIFSAVQGQDWPRSSPERVGIDPTVITSINQDIEDGKYGFIDHFLVIRHGKLVANYAYKRDYTEIAKSYDTTNFQYNYDHPSWHPFYQGTNLHSLQSVTKSITSILLGIAMDEGYLSNVDTKPMILFKGYEQNLDPRRLAITLEDLLTMRSGIGWNEMTSYSNDDNSCIIMEAKDDWIQFVLDQPMKTDPGTVFDYNSGVSVLLGKLVQIATGQRIDKWAEDKLFGPLGITNYYWKQTPNGDIDTEGGLYLSSHDLAKIGYLYLKNGRWGDRQIVSEEWVKRSTKPTIKELFPDNDRKDPGYGYQWWIYGQEHGETTLFAGNGYGGQFLMVSPKEDLIVVFNGWNIHDQTELSSFKATQDRILPALRENED